MSHIPFSDPFDDDESPAEFQLRIDHELERTLAMTPAEIREDLAAMGYDVPALEREARQFLEGMGWKPRRRRAGRLYSVAAPIIVLAGIAEVVAPSVPELLPMAAHPPDDPPAATAAAAAPAQLLEDGGSDDARSR